MLLRSGYPDPDIVELQAPTTHAEDLQNHYDDLFWHAKGPKYFPWRCDLAWTKWSIKLSQEHHTWGHRRRDENSKRKTLRTHRDGSRRKFKLRVNKHKKAVKFTTVPADKIAGTSNDREEIQRQR